MSEKDPVAGFGPFVARAGFRAELLDAVGDEVLVVRAYGELDLANRHELRSTIDRRLRSRHGTGALAPPETPGLVLDLSQATYVGATIIAALVEETERTPQARSRPRLVVGRGGMLNRLAAILALSEIFDVFEDLDEALASLW